MADEIAAAEFFPRVSGATVLHVHHAGGRFLAGGRELTQMEFLDEVMKRLGLPPGEPVILVACGTAALTGTVHAVATLAMLADRPVVGATGNAYTTAGGEVVTAHAGVDVDGRMVIVPDQPAHWVVARAGPHADGGTRRGSAEISPGTDHYPFRAARDLRRT